MKNKILIFGFPHSGTTILRKVFGQCLNVYAYPEEKNKIENVKQNYKYTCIKWPHFLEKFLTDEYSDYIKIFILRDPRYTFSSLNRRGKYSKKYHTIEYWDKTAKYFLENKQTRKCETLLYSEMFDNNFKRLKDIFDKYEIVYSEKTFLTQKEGFTKPKPSEHIRFRKWQINQAFENMNYPEKIDLKPHQEEKILNLETYKKLFKELK